MDEHGNRKGQHRNRRAIRPAEVAFAGRVQKNTETGCHIWTGKRDHYGYGIIVRGYAEDRRHLRMHRVAYELAKGPIPTGLQIDHLCRNRACVNPDHLEAVTQRVNLMRGVGPAAEAARRTHCVHGHAFPSASRVGRIRRCHPCERLRYLRKRKAAWQSRFE